MKLILIAVLAAVFGCSKKSNLDSVPEFYMVPLSGSGLPDTSVFAAVTGGFPSQEDDGFLCTEELKAYNKKLLEGTDAPNDLVDTLYARTVSYDCDFRQQIKDAGEPTVADSVKTILRTGTPAEDDTQFLAWTGDKDSLDSEGKLINIYLQDDGIKYKQHVGLAKKGGLKTINVYFHIRKSASDIWQRSRSYFQEVAKDGTGDVSEHYVGGRLHQRHYQSSGTKDVVFVIRAHLIKDVGSAVFKTVCKFPISEDYATKDCVYTASSKAEENTSSVTYYNESGEKVNDPPSGLITDIAEKIEGGDKSLADIVKMDSFLPAGATDDNHFETKFVPSSN